MNKLSTDEIVVILRNIDMIERLTLAMRREVRPPTADELYPASAAVDVVRGLILGASVHPIEMESVPDNATPPTEPLAPLEPRAPRRPRKPAEGAAPVADTPTPTPPEPPPTGDELPFDRWEQERSHPATADHWMPHAGGEVLNEPMREFLANKESEVRVPEPDPYQQIADRILEKVRGAKSLPESAALASDVDVIAGLKTLNAEAPTLAAQVKQEAIAKRDELAKGAAA